MELGDSSLSKRRIPKQFLGAFKQGHRFAARQFVDDEFSYLLLEKALNGDIEALRALEFMTKFNNEIYKGVFKRDDTDFFKNQDRLDRQNEMYAMEVDVFVRTHESLPTDRPPQFADEDTLIALIDLKIEMEKSKKQ